MYNFQRANSKNNHHNLRSYITFFSSPAIFLYLILFLLSSCLKFPLAVFWLLSAGMSLSTRSTPQASLSIHADNHLSQPTNPSLMGYSHRATFPNVRHPNRIATTPSTDVGSALIEAYIKQERAREKRSFQAGSVPVSGVICRTGTTTCRQMPCRAVQKNMGMRNAFSLYCLCPSGTTNIALGYVGMYLRTLGV